MLSALTAMVLAGTCATARHGWTALGLRQPCEVLAVEPTQRLRAVEEDWGLEGDAAAACAMTAVRDASGGWVLTRARTCIT